MRKKSSARRESESERHDSNAAPAALTARSTSSVDANSTIPVCVPVAGLKTGPRRPDWPAYGSPAIQWWIGLTAVGDSTTSVISRLLRRRVSLDDRGPHRPPRDGPPRPSPPAPRAPPGAHRLPALARAQPAAP